MQDSLPCDTTTHAYRVGSLANLEGKAINIGDCANCEVQCQGVHKLGARMRCSGALV